MDPHRGVLQLIKSKIPTYSDLTSLYLNGLTQEEIIRIFDIDDPTMNFTNRKRDTKNKIIHFFKVIEGSKKAYIRHHRARINRTELLSYTNKKTLISTTSIMRVLEALEKQGWSLQEATRDKELLERYPEGRN